MPWNDLYRLRPIEEADLEKVLEWRNSDRIRAVMFTDRFITMDEHKTWFNGLNQKENTICLIFEFKGHPVGVVNIVQIDKSNHKCSWGFYLGEVDVPRGVGTLMGYLALEYIFKVLDIRKLSAEAFTFNTQSLNFHKKLGFIEEGRFVKHILKNGNYEDVISMALFNEDWMKLKSKLKRITL